MQLWEYVRSEGLRKNQVWLPLLKARGKSFREGAVPPLILTPPSQWEGGQGDGPYQSFSLIFLTMNL